MDIHEALQTAGQYIYIGFRALLEGLQKLFGMLAVGFKVAIAECDKAFQQRYG